MTFLTPSRPRGALVGLTMAGLIASEGLYPALRRRAPKIIPATTGNPEADRIIGFHGLRGSPADLDPLVEGLPDLGMFHRVATGSDFRDCAPFAADYVAGLTPRPLLFIGESLGGLCAFDAMCRAAAAKLPIAGLVVISTPPTAQHPIWPPAMRRGSAFLHGGAPTYAVAQVQTVLDLVRAYRSRRTDPRQLPKAWSYARRCLRIPSASLTSGGTMLRHLKFRTGTPDVPCLVVQFAQDPWVLPGFDVWMRMFPQAQLLTVSRRGHNLADSPEVITTGIRDWRLSL
jgi:hypothetical protein